MVTLCYGALEIVGLLLLLLLLLQCVHETHLLFSRITPRTVNEFERKFQPNMSVKPTSNPPYMYLLTILFKLGNFSRSYAKKGDFSVNTMYEK